MNKKIVSALVISTLLLTSCGKTEEVKVEQSPAKGIVSTSVKKDFFSEDIKLTGKVTPLTETPVSPLVS